MCLQEGEDAIVCLKSEVDKVIAGLNKQIESLKKKKKKTNS